MPGHALPGAAAPKKNATRQPVAFKRKTDETAYLTFPAFHADSSCS